MKYICDWREKCCCREIGILQNKRCAQFYLAISVFNVCLFVWLVVLFSRCLVPSVIVGVSVGDGRRRFKSESSIFLVCTIFERKKVIIRVCADLFCKTPKHIINLWFIYSFVSVSVLFFCSVMLQKVTVVVIVLFGKKNTLICR